MSAFEGCPGSRMMDLTRDEERPAAAPATEIPSQLRNWPIQMHLVSPAAPYFQGADLLLAADCTAYALGGFHSDHLKGKALTIACPKLDQNQEIYLDKIRALIDDAKVNTITVLIMQVPCCRGLVGLVQRATAEASRKVPVKAVVVGLQGEIISEDWL
jgi:hypothetical protein